MPTRRPRPEGERLRLNECGTFPAGASVGTGNWPAILASYFTSTVFSSRFHNRGSLEPHGILVEVSYSTVVANVGDQFDLGPAASILRRSCGAIGLKQFVAF